MQNGFKCGRQRAAHMPHANQQGAGGLAQRMLTNRCAASRSAAHANQQGDGGLAQRMPTNKVRAVSRSAVHANQKGAGGLAQRMPINTSRIPNSNHV